MDYNDRAECLKRCIEEVVDENYEKLADLLDEYDRQNNSEYFDIEELAFWLEDKVMVL